MELRDAKEKALKWLDEADHRCAFYAMGKSRSDKEQYLISLGEWKALKDMVKLFNEVMGIEEVESE